MNPFIPIIIITGIAAWWIYGKKSNTQESPQESSPLIHDDEKQIAVQKSLPPTLPKRCDCTSKVGDKKKLFRYLEEAEATAKHWLNEKGNKQTAYECPENKGWHHLRTVREKTH